MYNNIFNMTNFIISKIKYKNNNNQLQYITFILIKLIQIILFINLTVILGIINDDNFLYLPTTTFYSTNPICIFYKFIFDNIQLWHIRISITIYFYASPLTSLLYTTKY